MSTINSIRHNRTIEYLRQILYAERNSLIVAFFLMLAAIAMILVTPWPIKYAFDYVLLGNIPEDSLIFSLFSEPEQQKFKIILLLASLVVIFAVIKGLFSYYYTYITTQIGHKIVFKLRHKLFSHLQQLSLNYHQQSRSGEILSKLTQDTNAVKNILAETMLAFVIHGLTIIGMFMVMFYLNWTLSLILLISFPVLFYFLHKQFNSLKKEVRKQRKTEGKMAIKISEVLSAIPLIRSFAREQFEQEKFNTENKKNYSYSVNISKLEASTARSAEVITAVGTAVVLLIGSLHVIQEKMTPGDILIFLSYVAIIYKPVRQISKLTSKFSRGLIAIERISEILNTNPEIIDNASVIESPRLTGKIVFDSVNYTYPGNDNNSLDNVSFEIEQGSKIMIVGKSGAGKSTIAKLILRLIEPDSGNILIDEVDVSTIERNSLRDQISIVLQSNHLFATSIAENIRYGKIDASINDVKNAARIACADSFISNLPEKYLTHLGERGSLISGGQQQLLSIARALLKNPAILIMDEPTSSLDPVLTRQIYSNLFNECQSMTVIMIAHNLQYAGLFDNIFYLENGRLKEQGNHDTLMENRSDYYRFYSTRNTPLRRPNMRQTSVSNE